MNYEDFSRVAAASLASIETLLYDWFPNGERQGLEFCIGSSSGEAGQSLRIRLEGSKAGCWSDFSRPDSEAGGDLISLYAYIHGITQGKACAALARQFGIELTETPGFKGKQNPVSPVIVKSPPVRAPAQAAQGVEDIPAKKARTAWEPVMPIPETAGKYPLAHPHRGRSDRHWTYIDDQGRAIGYIHRFTNSKGGKEIIPCVYAQHPVTKKCDWRWIAFSEPRPLYFRRPLDPNLIKVIVEGEKCADAGFELIGDYYDCLSWPGGGKSVGKADWEKLRGSTVILWADADAQEYKSKDPLKPHPKEGQIMPEDEQPGMITMRKLADILRNDYACTVHFVDIPAPGVKPGGWDVADMVEEGADQAEVLAFLETFRPTTESELEPIPAEAMPPAEPEPQGDDGIPADFFLHDEASPSSPAERPASAKAKSRTVIRSMMIPTSSGGIKGCRENVYIAMKNDPALVGLVALDQFASLQVKRRDPPWTSEPGEWNEGDDFQLGIYLANHYGLLLSAIGDIEKGVAQVARENGFNPVVDLFDACEKAWDGVPRIDNAFATYWGAEHSEYLTTVARMFFVGLAKRVYVPGVKNDYAPVFEGGQGEGKSTALSIIGGDWFADTPFRMGEKDGFLSIQGILIYEIAELEQFNRSEVTAVKAFMSSQKDRYREPYGRRMKNQLRRTVFAATTNEGQYFKDMTGNRRFWPVKTGRLDLDGLRRDREQILGEAVHRMRAGELWYPTRSEQADLINPEQESRELWDEWAGDIWDYIEAEDDASLLVNEKKRNRVTARELLTKALGFEIHKIGNARSETMRVSNIMRKYGWTKDRDPCGAREYFYQRPEVVVKDVVQAEGGGDDHIPF